MAPENFAQICPTVQKLRHFFEVTHGHTDGRTKTNHFITTTEFFFGIYVRGKEENSTNPTKFLRLHFVKEYETIFYNSVLLPALLLSSELISTSLCVGNFFVTNKF